MPEDGVSPRAGKDELPMCGQPAKCDRQIESSWSRDDHEDGGPTIRLPAAEPAAPLTLSTCDRVYPQIYISTCTRRQRVGGSSPRSFLNG